MYNGLVETVDLTLLPSGSGPVRIWRWRLSSMIDRSGLFCIAREYCVKHFYSPAARSSVKSTSVCNGHLYALLPCLYVVLCSHVLVSNVGEETGTHDETFGGA